MGCVIGMRLCEETDEEEDKQKGQEERRRGSRTAATLTGGFDALQWLFAGLPSGHREDVDPILSQRGQLGQDHSGDRPIDNHLRSAKGTRSLCRKPHLKIQV